MSEDPLCRLRVLGRCLDDFLLDQDWEAKMPASCDKVCLILANSSVDYRLKLGPAPFNDCVTFGKILKEHDFDIFFLRNPDAATFRKFFAYLLRLTQRHFCLFYAGHGHLQRAVAGSADDEDPFVFDDDSISDSAFFELFTLNRTPGTRLTLVTDSCAPESVFDIRKGEIKGHRVPENVVSVSALVDPELIKDVEFKDANRGEFVTDLVKWLKKDPALTPKDLYFSMRKVMKKWGQDFVVGASDEALLAQPLFD